jgi:hypothetical protein
MIILSHGADWIRVSCNSGVYHYTELNPYVVRRVLHFIKHEAEGRAWNLLKKYPVQKESIDAYLQRIKHATSSVPV